jgi:hypothetical protein
MVPGRKRRPLVKVKPTTDSPIPLASLDLTARAINQLERRNLLYFDGFLALTRDQLEKRCFGLGRTLVDELIAAVAKANIPVPLAWHKPTPPVATEPE